MNEGMVIAALRKHAKQRREIIDTALHRDMKFENFIKLRGEDDECKKLEMAIEEAMAKASAADLDSETPEN